MAKKLDYFMLACSRVRNGFNTAEKVLHHMPSSKTNCKVKIKAIGPDGKYRLIILSLNTIRLSILERLGIIIQINFGS